MHCHCGTNNRAQRWTFTDPCKTEVRPGAREESASPAWLAAPAMNARILNLQYWRDKYIMLNNLKFVDIKFHSFETHLPCLEFAHFLVLYIQF